MLRDHRGSFHDARTPEVLLEHWRQMRLWHLLVDQSGTPPFEKTSDFTLVERNTDFSMASDWQLTMDECRTASALSRTDRELNEWNSSKWACSRVRRSNVRVTGEGGGILTFECRRPNFVHR